MVKKKKQKSSLGFYAGIGMAATFAVVAVLLFFPVESLFIKTTPAEIENIQIEVPDADKLGKDSIITGAPELFQDSTQNPLEILIDDISTNIGIGEPVTEKFLIAPKIILLDANQEQQLSETTLIIEPLDPRTTVDITPTLVPQPTTTRFFINTDFATQISVDGLHHHAWSGWEKYVDGSNPSPSWQFTRTCGGIVKHNDGCVMIEIHRGNCTNTLTTNCPAFPSVLYGFFRVADISDWTLGRPLKFGFDYSVQGTTRDVQYIAQINGKQFILDPSPTGHFEVDATDVLCTTTDQSQKCDDTITVVMGLNPLRSRNTDGQIFFNNAFVSGPSIAKREALNTLEQLSLFSTGGGKILDLGFIQVALDGITVNPNEKIVLEGIMEIRLDDKTVDTKRVSATGITSSDKNSISINIEGKPTLAFRLDDELFTEGFHDFKIVLRDFLVNVGEGTKIRTFEYHKNFIAYILEFNFNGDQFVAFGQDNKAISVFTNDSTLKTCGLTEGLDSTEPEVKPPVVQVLDQGFTIIKTNPEAGKFQKDIDEKTNRIYCSIYPNVPRDTALLFKVGDKFFDVISPPSQKNWDVTCNRLGCTSNFGYNEVFEVIP